jgi:hypothetical protein
LSRRVWQALFGLSIAAVIAPLFTARYLPFTDAPEHAAVMATLAHWGDPAFSGPYELAILRSQYLLFHGAGAALAALLGNAELACRVLLVATGIATPLAFRALLRAAGRDERLALFGCLVFWSRALVVGFLPFVAAIPIALYALALVFRAVRRRAPPGARLLVAIGASAVVLFYAHVSAWMVFLASAGALALLTRRWRVLVAVAPSVVASAGWLLVGRVTLGEGSLADAGEIGRMGIGRALVAMPLWVFDVWRGHVDDVAAIGWWVGLVLVATLGMRSLARYPRRSVLLLYAPLACVLAIYLATPFKVGAGLMLNVRLAPILVLLAFLPMRLPRRGALGTAALGLAVAANLVGGANAVFACGRANVDLGDLDAVLAPIGRGARLETLTYDIRSPETHIFPWAHVGAYHRARRGGVAGFSFSELHHWPVHYKPSEAPPRRPGTKWDLDPCAFRNAVDGEYYDFVLVRGRIDPFRDHPPGPVFAPLVTRGKMTLYRKEAGSWPAGEVSDPGPCQR